MRFAFGNAFSGSARRWPAALLLFVALGLGYSITAAAHSPVCGDGISLEERRWTLFSAPCAPMVPTVQGVFGDDLNVAQYDIRWVVYARDEASDSYAKLGLSSPIVQGMGYWIYSLDPANLDVDGTLTPLVRGNPNCPSPAGCFEILLTSPDSPASDRYNMIGNPFPYDVTWADALIEVDGTAYNPSAVQMAGLGSKTIHKYNGNGYDPFDDETPGMTGTLNPFDGFWLLVPGAAASKTVKLLILGESQPLTAAEFVQAAPRGFGDMSNSWAQSMIWWNNALYVGTGREAVCTSRFALWNFVRLTVDEVTADTYLPYPPPDPDLSCATEGADLPIQAEIWRWTPDDEMWDRVYQSPLDLDNPGPGSGEPAPPGKKLPYEITFRGMVSHTESDGTDALYAFGVNSTLMWDSTILPPPRILRSTDGENFDPLPQTPGTFLGDLPHNPDHSSFRSPVSFNGKLFVLSGPIFGQGSLIVSENPEEGDDAWSLASPPEVMFYEIHEFNGWLYLGTIDAFNGYSIVKTRAEGAPPYDFIPVIPAGAGLPETPSRSVVSMHVHNGQLYVGTATKTELIRINPDDTWDLVIGEPREVELPDGSDEMKYPIGSLDAGFGQSVNDHAWKMLSHNGSLYIGTYNVSTWFRDHPDHGDSLQHILGADLYRTEDGRHFSAITTDGFTDPLDPFGGKFDYGFRTMVETPYGMFMGSANDFYGLAIFRAKHKDTVKPEPPGHFQIETLTNNLPLLSWQASESPLIAKYQVWRAEVDNIRIREELNYLNWDFTINDGNLIEDTVAAPYEKVGETTGTDFIDSTILFSKKYLYYVVAETTQGEVSEQSNLATFPPYEPVLSFSSLLSKYDRLVEIAARNNGGVIDNAVQKAILRGKIVDARNLALLCQLESASELLEPRLARTTFILPESTDLEILISRILRRMMLYEKFPGLVDSDEFCIP